MRMTVNAKEQEEHNDVTIANPFVSPL